MQYDYYKILNVSRNSSYRAIKKSYWEKAKIFHPDRNPDPQAKEMFAIISEAYETLGDRTTRRKYDYELRMAYRKVGREESYNQPTRSQEYRARRRQNTSRKGVYTEAKKFKNNPLIYNALFLFGMLAGTVVMAMAVTVFMLFSGWSNVSILFVFPGYILVRDGWRGWLWKKKLLRLPVVKQLNSFFRLDFDNNKSKDKSE